MGAERVSEFDYIPALKVGGTSTLGMKSLGSNFDHRLSYRICTVGEL